MKKVLLDSNVLLLFLVGNIAGDRIGTHRRLREYDAEDLVWLNKVVETFQAHVTLPNIMTEVSNHIGDGDQTIHSHANAALSSYCNNIAEVYVESRDVVRTPSFPKIGLTDSAILRAARPDVTVITVDHKLAGFLNSQGSQVENLWHHKTPR